METSARLVFIHGNNKEKLEVGYNTVMRAIEQLEARGILSKVGEAKRGRVFCAKTILDILEEPARLRAR